jgi:hypothetical protein
LGTCPKKTRWNKSVADIQLNVESYYVSNFEELLSIPEESITLTSEIDRGLPWPDQLWSDKDEDYNVRVYESYKLEVLNSQEAAEFAAECELRRIKREFQTKMVKYRRRYILKMNKALFQDMRSLRKVKTYKLVGKMMMMFISHFRDNVFDTLELRMGLLSICTTMQLVCYLALE